MCDYWRDDGTEDGWCSYYGDRCNLVECDIIN